MCIRLRKFGSLLCLLVLFSGCALSRSARVLKENPDLRPADGKKGNLEWTEAEQSDYVVFYGKLKKSSAGAGIYVGGSPSFKPPKDAVTIEGKLGVFDVTWYPLQSDKAKFYRTCLIDYQKAAVTKGRRVNTYVTRRHVWAYADTEEELNAVLLELNRLTMFAAKPPDLVM